jgi:hypothetical protein
MQRIHQVSRANLWSLRLYYLIQCIFRVRGFGSYYIESRYQNCNINVDVWWNTYREWNDILDKISLVYQMRPSNVWFSPPRTVLSLSLTLLCVLSVLKRLLYFSLRMMLLDESLNVKSVKSHFTRRYHTRWRMKNYGTEQLWFNYDKPSKVKNCHVTACFSVLSKGWLCWMSGFFLLSSVWKQIPMPFKGNKENTT